MSDPQITVIVPVYRMWHLVPHLLDALAAQTLPARRREVLLVDNGSPDFAPPAALPDGVHVLRCERPGSYAARNLAAAEARGALLCFTDADCRPAPQWLEQMAAAHEREGARTLLAGEVEVRPAGPRANAYETFDAVCGIPQERFVSRGYAATANLTLGADLLRELGGFDESRMSGGDADLCRRALERGARLVFVPEAAVVHPARTSWAELTIKSRRVLGGQLRAGSLPRRLYWLARALVPPVVAYRRLATASAHSPRARAVAIGVQTRLWVAGLGETVRLLAGGAPERR